MVNTNAASPDEAQTTTAGLFDLSRMFYYRLGLYALFYTIFQIVIFMHKPFVHVDFVFQFYLAVLVHFSSFIFAYKFRPKSHFLFYCLDVIVIFYLFYNQPQYSSFYLIYLSISIFMCGLEFDIKHNVYLTFTCSILLSLVNLKSTKWTGASNLLNMSLFNATFVIVGLISHQFRQELSQLKTSLNISYVKLQSKINLSKLLIEKMPIGLVATTSRKEIIFSNQILNDEYQLQANDIKELVHIENVKAHQNIKFYNSNLSEKRLYELEKAEYFDDELSDQVQLHLIKDVTDFVKMQDELKQKEKLAAVGQLAAGIAHEIRNPLAGISGSIELLSKENNNPDDQKLMKIIIREIDRLNNLITEFLSYSRPEERPDQIVDLALILDEVVQNIKLNASESFGVEFDVSLSRAPIYGHADKLKQAFMNIVVNAIQAMKDSANKKVQVKIESDADLVTVFIKDTGMGMSPEIKKRIFEPFYTTKSKGTGLGMAITHKILDSHQARIDILSEIGQGTEFKIVFKKA